MTRADWANYLASIEELDRKFGAVVARLEREGQLENTLIMFFGDHGRPHVRGKHWLYEGGLHTPLIVRWPGKVAPGEVKDGLVSLLDLMPTTLAAVEIAPPKLPGLDLLAEDWQGHKRLFAVRDRCGDAIDRIRSTVAGDDGSSGRLAVAEEVGQGRGLCAAGHFGTLIHLSDVESLDAALD